MSMWIILSSFAPLDTRGFHLFSFSTAVQPNCVVLAMTSEPLLMFPLSVTTTTSHSLHLTNRPLKYNPALVLTTYQQSLSSYT